MTQKKTSKPGTAGELYTATRELKDIAYRLRRKYYLQEIQYKTIGASRKALKANANRRELVEELLQVIMQYEQVVCKAMDKEFKARRHVQFTINPYPRR